MDPKDFFTKEQKAKIEQAISEAEKLTSGEIRLHIDSTCKGDPVKCAIKTFNRLGMANTDLRNGVLFYISIDDQKFAVVGDKGINETVPAGFWDHIYSKTITYFKNRKFAEGLCWGILEAGKQLASHFPIQEDDANELTNEISF